MEKDGRAVDLETDDEDNEYFWECIDIVKKTRPDCDYASVFRLV